MDTQEKTKNELKKELQKLQQEYNSITVLYDKNIAEQKLAKQELLLANKELVFQNREKEKRADELNLANKELAFQNEEKEKRAAELILANKELVFQNREKEKRADELNLANKELAFQNEEKEKRAAELILANKELLFQNEEKEKRAAELILANKELVFQNREKEKRADELIIANKELAFQNEEKEKRAAELVLANKELLFQNEEKEKRAAELIIAKEHAEESDRLKSAFLANISHEIRTPMNGLLGFSQLLKEPGLTDKEQKEYLRCIDISGARMINIITDIVNISKIETAQMDVSMSETNINEQIEKIYSFFKSEVEGKGIQLLVKTALLSKESIIKTDKAKIYSILSNLVSNAIKYTSAGIIEFGYTRKGKYLEFFVKDSGIGIPKEKQELVFDPFRQVSESHSRKYEGAGLGLSISKAYVELLGGKIWVKSEFGKGSIFYFTIPFNVETDEKILIKEVPSEIGADKHIMNLKILIAEDDDISKEFISMAVKKYCKELFRATSGVEAVEICRNNSDIDLVLMDIRMPEMNGYEATRRIREFNKDVVIIAQTAYTIIGDREKAITAGCNDYISKPINKDEFLVLIQKHFNN